MRRLVDAVSETNLGRHRISPATTSPTSFLITTFYAICARGINHYVKRSTIRLCWKLILTDHTHSRYRNLPSPLVDETREDHELLSLSFSLSYQTVIPNYERWWITITSRISSWTRQFSTFRTEHTGSSERVVPPSRDLPPSSQEEGSARGSVDRGINEIRWGKRVGWSVPVKLERRLSDLCKGRSSVPFTKKAAR